MAILGIYSKAGDFGYPPAKDVTVAGTFDAAWASSSIRRANNEAGPGLPVPAGAQDIWFHFEIQTDSVSQSHSSNSDGTAFGIDCPSTASTGLYFRGSYLNGTLVYYGSVNSNLSNSQSSSGVAVPWAENRTVIDIRVQIDAAGSDIITVYHDGIQYYQYSATHGNATAVGSLQFYNQDINCNTHLSQLIVADESTLGMKIARMDPDSAGAHSQWLGDHTSVIAGGDGLAITSDTIGDRESWNLSAYPGPASPTGIRGVFVTSQASLGPTAVPGGFEHFLRVGGVDYDGAKIVPVPGLQSITEWSTNPNTAAAWDTADLAALIAGVEAVA